MLCWPAPTGIAVDAVGVALLRHFGTTPEVSRGSIFAQEQIARAVELGLGITEPAQIALVTGDPESVAYRGADSGSAHLKWSSG